MKMHKTVLPVSVIASVLALTLGASHAQANNLFGIDVSSYQGSINWSSVKANGCNFTFIKATEGNYYEDPDFKSNVANAKAAGLQVGAYDFVRPDIDCPSTDANYFWNFAGSTVVADKKTLSPVEDFEVHGNDCEANETAWANAWANDVKAKTSLTLHIIFYTGAAFACDFIEYDKSGGIQPAPWIANYNGGNLYTGNPWETYDCCNAWTTGCGSGGWKFWQVSSTGQIGGVSGDCDFDAYNGSLSSLISNFGVH